METLELLSVSGKSQSGETIVFTYIGIKMGLTYIQPFIETNLFKTIEEKYTKEINIKNIRNYIKEINSDLLIIAHTKKDIESLHTHKDIILPFRIHQIINTQSSWDEVKKNISKRETKRLEKQKNKHQLDFYTTYQDEAYFYFYDHMHVPTMEKRFGALARSVEINKAYNEIFKNGILFLITKSDIPVSGSVSQIDSRKNWLNARLIGVLNGDEYYRNIGAQNHVYHSILEWACSNNEINYVNFQGCEPFLTKGTFQYKKRFGTTAILPPNFLYDKRLLLRFNSNSDSINNFLINNPIMIIDERNNLGACYFKNQFCEARLDIPYKCKGMKYHKVIDLQTNKEVFFENEN